MAFFLFSQKIGFDILHEMSKPIFMLEGNYVGKEEVDLEWKKVGWLLNDLPSYLDTWCKTSYSNLTNVNQLWSGDP